MDQEMNMEKTTIKNLKVTAACLALLGAGITTIVEGGSLGPVGGVFIAVGLGKALTDFVINIKEANMAYETPQVALAK